MVRVGGRERVEDVNRRGKDGCCERVAGVNEEGGGRGGKREGEWCKDGRHISIQTMGKELRRKKKKKSRKQQKKGTKRGEHKKGKGRGF